MLVCELSVSSVLNIINHEISNKDREKVKLKKKKKPKEEEEKERNKRKPSSRVFKSKILVETLFVACVFWTVRHSK